MKGVLLIVFRFYKKPTCPETVKCHTFLHCVWVQRAGGASGCNSCSCTLTCGTVAGSRGPGAGSTHHPHLVGTVSAKQEFYPPELAWHRAGGVEADSPVSCFCIVNTWGGSRASDSLWAGTWSWEMTSSCCDFRQVINVRAGLGWHCWFTFPR